ncbi:MAG TPA: PH domain-containing protein [Steroidobacteraceae bacterium]|nr:PH domain-containing protein [Steroidobacteraceae bacterium]
MRVTFPSKVDRKLRMLGLAMPCVALIAIGTNAGHGRGVLLPLAIMTTVIAGLVLWMLLSTYYEFTGELLVAHSGPFSWRIPLKEISSVRESQSVRSGPALSMDRLEVAWGEGRVLLISPEDKAGFLAVLHRHAPQLTP